MPSWADRGHMSHKDTLAGCRVMGIEHVECKDGNITKGHPAAKKVQLKDLKCHHLQKHFKFY